MKLYMVYTKVRDKNIISDKIFNNLEVAQKFAELNAREFNPKTRLIIHTSPLYLYNSKLYEKYKNRDVKFLIKEFDSNNLESLKDIFKDISLISDDGLFLKSTITIIEKIPKEIYFLCIDGKDKYEQTLTTILYIFEDLKFAEHVKYCYNYEISDIGYGEDNHDEIYDTCIKNVIDSLQNILLRGTTTHDFSELYIAAYPLLFE